MITIQLIKAFSQPHRMHPEGKQTIISNGQVEISIVGGSRGLYGDFVEDFELAIIDKQTHEFVTKYYVPDATDDVLAYLSGEQVENIVNQIIGENFQVS